MNPIERFRAVCHFETPDYVPIFGFRGAPGMANGAMRKTHRRLVETGMPEWVDGCHRLGASDSSEAWHLYWGTTGPVYLGFFPADRPQNGIKGEKRIEGEFEIIEYNTGALTRQVIDNDETYSMPEFVRYHVRDRQSWDFYRDRVAHGQRWPWAKIEEHCRPLDDRDKPLCINVGSTWGRVRGLMGPHDASTVLYDDPALAHDIIDFFAWETETFLFPLIERLQPEIIATAEDCCFNHGMLISPKHFGEFCAPFYRKVGQVARACNVDMAAIDTDGNAMELVPIVDACGVTAVYPFEVKAGNDLFALRERHPRFILMGWLEKEVVNEGNEHLIEPEIMGKVPRLLEQGGYFPNGDHGIQPHVTFANMCRFMTLLHKATGNPEGQFPRMRP